MNSSEDLLSKAEKYILVSMMANQEGAGLGVEKYFIIKDLKSINDDYFQNFIDFKINLNIERLVEKSLIERTDQCDSPAYAITPEGKSWLLENENCIDELLPFSEKGQ
ncbi:hypothetical protein E3983_10285 [Legionella israelensis]|uniref:Transcriptional regulator n=1 Tax=Legionella israelensis TaxID=454 RepID=A0AAX1EIS1_9GAMM|nr:hypothetical protein [Legionella israelensis]QBR84717.1 hypothetical protein E3983_10285 [Legionella israelensis]